MNELASTADAEKTITLEHREAIRAYSGQCTLTQALHEDPRIGQGTYYAYRKQQPNASTR